MAGLGRDRVESPKGVPQPVKHRITLTVNSELFLRISRFVGERGYGKPADYIVEWLEKHLDEEETRGD